MLKAGEGALKGGKKSLWEETVANGGVSAGIHSQMRLLTNPAHITLHKLLGVSQCVNRVWDAHFYALVLSHLYFCSARITSVCPHAWLVGCWGLNPRFQSC